MITLFIVSSLEGWPDILYQAMDITEITKGPKFENNSIIAIIYFVTFIIIGSFFFINFFIGVLFDNFMQAKKREQAGLTNLDLAWEDIQKLILQTHPEYTTTNVPKEVWRKPFHEFCSDERFDNAIIGCILLNTIQMALEHEGMDPLMKAFLASTTLIFSIIF